MDDLSIGINVVEKKPKVELTRKQLVPSKVGGFATDVISHRLSLHTVDSPPNSLVRPILGGLQVQSDRFGLNEKWGTIGGVIQITGQTFGITNFHVLYGELDEEKAAHFGNTLQLVQPQKSFFGTPVGTSNNLFDRTLDYACISLSVPVNDQQSFDSVDGVIQGFSMPVIGMHLAKMGAATGRTRAIIDARSCVDCSNLILAAETPNANSSSLIADFGDSGSIWYNDDLPSVQGIRIVGLHFGGDTHQNIAFATSFSSISASINKKISWLKLNI